MSFLPRPGTKILDRTTGHPYSPASKRSDQDHTAEWLCTLAGSLPASLQPQ